MDEVAALMLSLLPEPLAVERLTYAEAFQRYLGIDPHTASIDQIRQTAIQKGISGAGQLEMEHRDGWLDLLLSHLIEPHLGRARMTFLYDYPASQAALARIRLGEPPVAERFELYLEGMEMANGFHELTDAVEQKARFAQEFSARSQQGLVGVPMDQNLLDALEAGLPNCAGVALGIDRLLMFLTGVEQIDGVIAFPFARA